MTTDRAGPEGTIGIAIDQGREGGDHSAAVLYWLGPDGVLHVLHAALIPMPYHTDCIYERLLGQPDEPAKPVGSVSRPPESRR